MSGRRSARDWTASTISEVAIVLTVSTRRVSEYLAAGCPGRKGRYPIPEMLVWLRENVWRVKPSPVPTDADMLDGGDSPALERYRLAKAAQEEIKLDTMRKDNVAREEWTFLHDIMADEYRRLGDRLVKQFGGGVVAEITRTLDEIDRRVEQRWGSDRAGPEIN